MDAPAQPIVVPAQPIGLPAQPIGVPAQPIAAPIQKITEECPICLERLTEKGAEITFAPLARLVKKCPRLHGFNSVLTPCGHLYHAGCLLSTLKVYRYGPCPTCAKKWHMARLIALRKMDDSCVLCKLPLRGPPANPENKPMPLHRRLNIGTAAVLLTHCGHFCHRFCALTAGSHKNPVDQRRCPECQSAITVNHKFTPVFAYGALEGQTTQQQKPAGPKKPRAKKAGPAGANPAANNGQPPPAQP